MCDSHILPDPDLPPLDLYMSHGLYDFFIRDRFGKQINESKNINLVHEGLSNLDFGRVMAESSFFLCPSTMEGYGHYINHARSSGGVIITTDAHPMNELIPAPEGGIFVKTKRSTHPHMILGGEFEDEHGLRGFEDNGLVAKTHPTHLCSAVDMVLDMSVTAREKMAARAQLQYHEDTKVFARQMRELRAYARNQVKLNMTDALAGVLGATENKHSQLRHGEEDRHQRTRQVCCPVAPFCTVVDAKWRHQSGTGGQATQPNGGAARGPLAGAGGARGAGQHPVADPGEGEGAARHQRVPHPHAGDAAARQGAALERERERRRPVVSRLRRVRQEAAAGAAKQQLAKLQEDFKYNLKLLEGRDEELALYDANLAALKGALRDREAERSELRAREAELRAELQRAKQRADESDAQCQQKLKDARAQVDGARWKFDDELRRQQDALEAQRRAAERQLRDKDEDAENQRRELSVAFDDVMRQREAEFKRAGDELQAKVRDLELSNKALAREADAQRARAEEGKARNDNLQQMLQENDKEVKALEWTLADTRAAKDTKVAELESEVATLNEVKHKLLDEYESKMAELLQSLHSVEKAFVQQKAQYDEDLQRQMEQKQSEAQEASARSEAKLEALTGRLRESEERVEALQAELKQAKWDADDKMMEKEREIERIKSSLQDLEDDQHHAASELQKQLRAGDRETQVLQDRLKDCQRQIALLKEKDKAQRQELLESVEKQEDLQRDLVAVNLRWENRWQDQQQELDERHELRLRELQQVKDRLLGEKEAIEERLLHAENEGQRLRSELSALKASVRISDSFGSQYLTQSRDVRSSSNSAPLAPSPLWSDDPGTLSPIPGVSPMLTDSPQLRSKAENMKNSSSLEMENAKLRDLIRQMKESLAQQAEEMEASSGQTSGSQSASKLAAQLLEARERCVALESRLSGLSGNEESTMLQLESCRRELLEAQRVIKAKTNTITELESQVQELEKIQSVGPELQSGRVALEAQLTDFKRKLEAANSDIDRLVRERSQLMELSNQLRADLRRSGAGDAGSRTSTPRVEFAGKKDYENMIAELTQSLEEARVHNKTLKKELRRMVKVHVQLQQEREAQGLGRGNEDAGSPGDGTSTTTGEHTQVASGKRHSSTLSMMKSLDPGPARRASARSASEGDGGNTTSKSDLDEQLLALARNKRASAREQSTKPRRSTRAVPPTISEDTADSDIEADVSATGEDQSEAKNEEGAPSRSSLARNADKSPLARIFKTPDRRDSAGTEDSNATIGGSSSTKVTDARLKLQQAKEMLMLSGKRPPVAGSRTSLVSFAAATATTARSSERETNSQRSAVKKLKQLQSKRAEMVSERKKVRNYNLTS
ncbi:unnamed protein product [Phytophthora fragariaefolia]|uniref:Unnamed protein product n=1 Tax=Phytophthora fragariaefolia TaxID=1490495 RepID=A0A9W6Y0I5_9STRA|nr:unnamed protein product [Phytophthora fragariaefolia]